MLPRNAEIRAHSLTDLNEKAGAYLRLHYGLEHDDPDATDVVNQAAAILHLQYSTQWDSLAHVGQLFDADDDGTPEPVFYNGYRSGKEIVGPSNPDDAGAIGSVPAKTTTAVHALGVE